MRKADKRMYYIVSPNSFAYDSARIKEGEAGEQKIRRDRNMGDNLRRLRDTSVLLQEKLCAELQRRG